MLGASRWTHLALAGIACLSLAVRSAPAEPADPKPAPTPGTSSTPTGSALKSDDPPPIKNEKEGPQWVTSVNYWTENNGRANLLQDYFVTVQHGELDVIAEHLTVPGGCTTTTSSFINPKMPT